MINTITSRPFIFGVVVAALVALWLRQRELDQIAAAEKVRARTGGIVK